MAFMCHFTRALKFFQHQKRNREGDSTIDEYEMVPGKKIYLCEVKYVESCFCVR